MRGSVSVCVPTFNQSAYLREAVESILAQSRPVQAIFVSDDTSTDDTYAVGHELAEKIPILHYERQPVNLGIARNTDFVLRRATTEFVVRLDSDDRLLPNYVEELARVLETTPQAAYAHGAVWQIDQFGERRHLRTLYRKPGRQGSDDAFRAAVAGYRVAANILMFRRTALLQVGYATGRPNYVEDYHMSVALARAGWENVYASNPVAEYRVWMDVKRTRAGRKLLELEGYRRTFCEELEPGFRERRWPLRRVNDARRKLAARHAVVLVEEAFSADERKTITAALRELGPGWRLSLRLALIRIGLGRTLVWIEHLDSVVRKKLKAMIRTLRLARGKTG